MTRRAGDRCNGRYSAVALRIETSKNCDGVSTKQFKYVTNTEPYLKGKGEPYLQDNDIVFDINEFIDEFEIIWPKQIGAHADNYAQIAQLKIHAKSGRRLKFE